MVREKVPLSIVSGLMARFVTCTFCKGPHSPVQISLEARFNNVREFKITSVVVEEGTKWPRADIANCANMDEDPISYNELPKPPNLESCFCFLCPREDTYGFYCKYSKHPHKRTHDFEVQADLVLIYRVLSEKSA